MKRAGFTMIELIFVIVILGILAAVAIPKLAATRTDAGVSKMSSNLQTVIKDVGGYYTSKGGTSTWDVMTGVPLYTGDASTTLSTTNAPTSAYLLIQSGGEACFKLDVTVDGNLTIVSQAGTEAVCVGAEAVALTNNLSDVAANNGVSHEFGQTGVVY